jgi:hypothetical protein
VLFVLHFSLYHQIWTFSLTPRVAACLFSFFPCSRSSLPPDFLFPRFCCPRPRSAQERADLVFPARAGRTPVECPDDFLAHSNFVARRFGHRVRSFRVGGLRWPNVPASSRRHWFFLFSIGLWIFRAAGLAAALSYFSLALFLLPDQWFPVLVSA